MTTAERQRKFQAAHPGYDRRRKARQRTAHTGTAGTYHAAFIAALEAEHAAATLEPHEPATATDGQLLLFPAMLPAA
jgi:hypothetical protein